MSDIPENTPYPRFEYRLKEIKRYVITQCLTGEDGNRLVSERGMYADPSVAYEVAYALAKEDQRRNDIPIDSMQVVFPERPDGYTEIAPGIIRTSL